MLDEVVVYTIWLPIRRRLELTLVDDGVSNYFKCLSDIVDSSEHILKSLDDKVTSVKTEIELPSDKNLNYLNILDRSHFANILKLEVGYKVPSQIQSSLMRYINGKPIEIENKIISDRDECIWSTAFSLSSIVRKLFVISCLAHLGHIRAPQAYIYYQDKCLDISEDTGQIDCLYLYEKSWPIINLIDVSKAVNWYIIIQKMDTKNRLLRMFNSFTHMLKTEFQFEILFWAMQALEIFYCKDRTGIASQLEENIILFLGDYLNKNEENLIKKLYNLRSDFVHGTFPVKQWEDDDNDIFDKENQKFERYTAIAIKLVVATLHKCILKGYTNVQFHTTIQLTPE